MRRWLRVVLICIALSTAAMPAVATGVPRQDPGLTDCLVDSAVADRALPGHVTCVRDANGNWVAEHDLPVTGPPGSGAFAALLVLALLWSLVPAIIAFHLAGRTGQNVGIAVLLALVLGWLGLLIVYLMSRVDTRTGAHRAVDALGPQYEPYPSPVLSGATTPEQRLRRLERLHSSGAITDAEYAAKRKQILDQL